MLQWAAEMNARITTTFFSWLVGPMELEEQDVKFQGRDERWRSKVQIKKCRYLEQSGCVGLCVNLCKVRHLAAGQGIRFPLAANHTVNLC